MNLGGRRSFSSLPSGIQPVQNPGTFLLYNKTRHTNENNRPWEIEESGISDLGLTFVKFHIREKS